MLFNSVEFIIFFVLFCGVFFVLPKKFKPYFLLLSSYYFYMCWKPEYIILILISTLIDFLVGLSIQKLKDKNKKKYTIYLLLISLFTNLGLLVFFKYFNFLGGIANNIFQNINILSNFEIPYLNIILPVGISFYTFQTISYTIEVYRGTIKPSKNLLQFALYVSFWPQLVAGPIERPQHLLPQFLKNHKLNIQRIYQGLQLIIRGFFKKVVIADRLAVFVNYVYNNPEGQTGPILILATIFFAFQIYCDFSGYSDIAIGTAKILGFDLMKNFRKPYLSRSISEFWRRRHISLSTWFKDYLYIPLGGNRKSKIRVYFNLLVTFVISGLWHGANWTFIIWGAINGIYLIIEMITRPIKKIFFKTNHNLFLHNSVKIFQTIITFGLICISWIFFRANNLSQAKYILINIFDWSKIQINQLNINSQFTYLSFIFSCILIFFLILTEFLNHKNIEQKISKKYCKLFKFIFYFIIFMLIILFGIFGSNQFIYFQF